MNGSLQLREYPGDIVRLSCEKCGRSGHYRKQKLIERYGADMRLPDLRERIAQCRRQSQSTTPAWFVTLIWCPRPISRGRRYCGEGDKVATGFFFFLFGADGGGGPTFDEVGSANLRASCGSPPFISRRLSM
jgi:hypothetical protein